MAIPQIASSKIHGRTSCFIFDRHGNSKETNNEQVKIVGQHADRYYLDWNKIKLTGKEKGLGIGPLIALFEIVFASLLAWLERSPATITNLLTTLGENAQVLIANLKNSKTDLSKARSQKERKEIEEQSMGFEKKVAGLSACIVAFGGALGLYKWVKEMFHSLRGNKHNIQESPLWQKIGLSLGSLVSTVVMGVGYLEKSLMSTLAKTQNGGMKSEQIGLNRSNDGRCTFEWLTMFVFLWVKKFKIPKLIIDFLLPLSALQDGLSHLFGHQLGHSHSHNHDQPCHEHEHTKESNNWFMKLLKKLLSHEHRKDIPSLVFNGLFLGRNEGSGLRSTLLTPLIRACGCEPFNCHLDRNNNLVVRV